MAKFLSLEYDARFFVGYCGFPLINPYDSNMLPIPKFERSNIDSLFIYCDLVEKSVRVGDVLANLLGIVTINKDLANMSNPMHIFRPLAHKYFHSASIRVTDQFGAVLDFEKTSFSAIEIVIRKRIKKIMKDS